jgi:hypothetical protein
MGIYENVYDCGDGDYCVTCAGTYNDGVSDLIVCNKHKHILPNPQIGAEFDYGLKDFIKRYSSISENPIKRVKVMDVKTNSRGHILTKLLVYDFTPHLNDMKKIYFTEFNDEPAWQRDGDNTIIIDIISRSNIYIERSPCRDESIYYEWHGNKIMRWNKETQKGEEL